MAMLNNQMVVWFSVQPPMFGVQFKFRERYAELSTLLRWATEPQTFSTKSGYGCHQAQSLPETLMIFYEFIESDAGRHILIDLNDAFTAGL